MIEEQCQNENLILYPPLHSRLCLPSPMATCTDTPSCARLRSRLADAFVLGPGTLYGSIQALLEGKLIEEVDRPEDIEVHSERRRYYRLTAAGRKLARSEAEKMAVVLRVARARKILRGDYV